METNWTLFMLLGIALLSFVAFVKELTNTEPVHEFALGWLFLAAFLSFIGLVLFIG